MQLYCRKFKNERRKYPIVSDAAIGASILERRRELGLTQGYLASRLGITRQQVQHYECGKNKLNVEQIQRISKALDVPVSHFFRSNAHSSEPLPLPRLTSAEQTFLGCFRRI